LKGGNSTVTTKKSAFDLPASFLFPLASRVIFVVTHSSKREKYSD